MPFSGRLLAIIAIACLTSASSGQEETTPDIPIHRVAIIGASVTAGYGVMVEVEEGGKKRKTGMNITDVFKASLSDQEVVFLDLGSSLFFMRPLNYARSSVSRAAMWDAELVLGIDFLFWCLYGSDDGKGGLVQNEAQRLEKLEMGLAILDELDVPLVIGDIPDMISIGTPLLSRSQLPDHETVLKANERIKEWASERPNIEVAGLHDFIKHIHAGESFTIGQYSWNLAEEDITIMSRDKLHPTIYGTIALAQALSETARTMEVIGTRLPPLDLQREAILARLQGKERKPRQPRRRSLQRSSLARSSRRRLRSHAPFACSSARAIACCR